MTPIQARWFGFQALDYLFLILSGEMISNQRILLWNRQLLDFFSEEVDRPSSKKVDIDGVNP